MMRLIVTVVVGFLVVGGAMADIDATQLVAAARSQIGVTVGYDPAYRRLSYPGGDVPLETGVCCDVVIRALRKQSVDLQRLLHEDMKTNFARYPKNWGLKAPDSNIDHRRVPNLACYFSRQGWSIAVNNDATAYRSGDLVTWNLGNGLTHIGIVSDRQTAKGTPLMIHNIGRGTQEEDILFKFTITGHYREKRTASQVPEPIVAAAPQVQH
jgi:uncharacterized protein YijF (DUF1287 family)